MGRSRARRHRVDRNEELLCDLFDEHARDLVAFFQSRTWCAATAADLCAETFAVAVANIDRFDPARGAAGAWLWGIARNQLRHFHRNSAVEDRHRRNLAMRVPAVHSDDLGQLDDRMDAEVVAAELVALVDELSGPVAAAVRARVLDGLSYDEVAQRCGCTVNAARVRVSRGLATIAERRMLPGEVSR
jgi:RNA polymerase sigma-70 factor (ECF subfamily)